MRDYIHSPRITRVVQARTDDAARLLVLPGKIPGSVLCAVTGSCQGSRASVNLTVSFGATRSRDAMPLASRHVLPQSVPLRVPPLAASNVPFNLSLLMRTISESSTGKPGIDTSSSVQPFTFKRYSIDLPLFCEISHRVSDGISPDQASCMDEVIKPDSSSRVPRGLSRPSQRIPRYSGPTTLLHATVLKIYPSHTLTACRPFPAARFQSPSGTGTDSSSDYRLAG